MNLYVWVNARTETHITAPEHRKTRLSRGSSDHIFSSKTDSRRGSYLNVGFTP